MKKEIIVIVFVIMLIIFGSIWIVWRAGRKWESCAEYDMPKDNALISMVLRQVFSREFHCLSFSRGIVYHGQDTFEVMKFDVDTSEASWKELTNMVYATETYAANYDMPRECIGIPNLISGLASDGEVSLGEFHREDISIFLTAKENLESTFLYIEGPLIPPSMLSMIGD